MREGNFTNTILSWYARHARDLPWRNTKDPYLIWLSEIILQQTRVNQGLPYFEKIQEAFPTVKDLAKVSETAFLRYWQGLGYYSRARNLLKTAKIISDRGGQFPSSFEELKKLPGIGEYTAAAIASFAFQEAVPVVDGNVFRILSRYFGIRLDISQASSKKYFFDLSRELISRKNPDIFNQAIMEFGSLQCWVKPQCETCPLIQSCFAYNHKEIANLPVKTKSIKMKKRYFHYIFIQRGREFFFQERKGKDIWEGLWEPYLIETNSSELKPSDCKALNYSHLKIITKEKIHQLSHQRIYSNAYFYQESEGFEIPKTLENRWLDAREIELMPKSILVENLINDNHLTGFLSLDK